MGEEGCSGGKGRPCFQAPSCPCALGMEEREEGGLQSCCGHPHPRHLASPLPSMIPCAPTVTLMILICPTITLLVILGTGLAPVYPQHCRRHKLHPSPRPQERLFPSLSAHWVCSELCTPCWTPPQNSHHRRGFPGGAGEAADKLSGWVLLSRPERPLIWAAHTGK